MRAYITSTPGRGSCHPDWHGDYSLVHPRPERLPAVALLGVVGGDEIDALRVDNEQHGFRRVEDNIVKFRGCLMVERAIRRGLSA